MIWPDGGTDNDGGSDTNDNIDKPGPGQLEIGYTVVEPQIREKQQWREGDPTVRSRLVVASCVV